MASLFTGTVEEYASLSAFPLVGVPDTIYIALNTNIIYRWNTGTNAYVELSPNIVTSLVFNDSNGFDGTINLVGSTATLTITTALTQGSVPFIGASGALTQDNTNFFFDDTNNRLGINTNSPTTALDVFGSGIIGRINGTSTNNAFLGFASAGTNKWSIGNVQSDHRFRIYNEATTSELVSVLQTGEFGIGIANPTTKLHIDGGASALIANLDANVSVAKSVSFRSDNSARINLEVSGTESGSNVGADFFIRRYSDAGALIDTPFTITRSTGAITLTGSLNGANATFSSTLTATAFIPSGSTVPTNGMYLSAANTLNFATNTTNRIIVTSAGNVGIGGTPFTISDTNLTVNGATGASIQLGFNGTRYGQFYTDNAEVRLSSVANLPLTFYSNNLERMRITSGGLIGINTSIPTGRLMIYQGTAGNVFQNIVSPQGGSTQVGINFSPSMTDTELTSNPAQASIYATDSNFGANIIFATKATGAVGNSLVERVRITSAGNLQITASDSALYTRAAGSGKAIYWDIRNSADSRRGYIGFGGDGSSDFQFSNNENGSQSFITNGTERMRITNEGWFRASNTGTYITGSFHEFSSSLNNSTSFRIKATSSIFTDYILFVQADKANNSDYSFMQARSSNTSDTEFNLRGDGNAYADGSWNGGGADYAEFFEWLDGNPNNEDRRGYSVSLVGNKIKIAQKGETIIGVISGNPSVIGDSAWNMWTEKYLRDDFGTYIRDEEGFRILNPNYNPDIDYISREERPEWGIVGLMGKLCIRKGQEIMPNWIKMQDISDNVEQWLIK